MGSLLSTSENPNHFPSHSTIIPMSEPPQSEPQSEQQDPKAKEIPNPEISDQSGTKVSKAQTDVRHQQEEEPGGAAKKEGEPDEEEDEEEEEGECGFCLFMKGGGCKDTFIAWEQCVEEAEKKEEDIVDKCFEVTSNLRKCMQAHADYYEPIIKAEKKAEEEAVNQLEQENKSQEQKSEQSDGSDCKEKQDDKKEN